MTLFKFLSTGLSFFCYCFTTKVDNYLIIDRLFYLYSALWEVFNRILRFWKELEFFLTCRWLLEITANTFFYLFWNSFILSWHLQRFEHLEWDWIYISSFLAATCFIIISFRKLKAVSFSPNVFMKAFSWKSIQAELLISVSINFSDPCFPTFMSISSRWRPIYLPLNYCFKLRPCMSVQF